MDFGKEHEIIILGLKKIISENGHDVFDEPRRAKALIADYFPRISTSEKNLLNISCECGIYKMIVHSTSYEDRNVYMKAKCLLIDDYMIAEQAAEITLERIFKACGKHIPDGVSSGTTNRSPYGDSVASDSSLSNKIVQQNSLASKDELERKVLILKEKYVSILKEPLNEMQKNQLLLIKTKIDCAIEKVKEKDNLFTVESHDAPLYKAIDSCIDEINAFERDVLNGLPTETDMLFASMQFFSRNTMFYIQTFNGLVLYTTKACLFYNGKQYVVAQMPPANFNAVFVVCNNMLILDTDANSVNYLVNYCQLKGLLN